MTPLSVEPGQWFRLQDVPALHPNWPASPVLVTAVTPLKTGKSLLEISYVRPFRPVEAAKEVRRLKVVLRGGDHFVGSELTADGTTRLVLLTPLTTDWLRGLCPQLCERRSWLPSNLIAVGYTEPDPTGPDYAAILFGETLEDVLSGAREDSFGCEKPPMPEKKSMLMLDATLNPFESWLVWRGRVPKVMEEKWFVYQRGGRLLFRRSWTGILVYEVEVQWRGDRLHLGQAWANRDREQYVVTDDAYDRALLCWTIDVVLRSVPSEYPMAVEHAVECSPSDRTGDWGGGLAGDELTG